MHIEARCAQEAVRLVVQCPPKYCVGVASLYAASVIDPEIGREARASYFFLRDIDDKLDGDVPFDGNPLAYARAAQSAIETSDLEGAPPIAELGEYAATRLEEKAREDDDPRADFSDIIETIVFDHERAQERRILTDEELHNYYIASSEPTHNIILTSLGSELRGRDVRPMSTSWGISATVEDFEEDWDAGRINIPEHILTISGANIDMSGAQILHIPLIQQWLRIQIEDQQAELQEFDSFLKDHHEKRVRKVYRAHITWNMRKLEKAVKILDRMN